MARLLFLALAAVASARSVVDLDQRAAAADPTPAPLLAKRQTTPAPVQQTSSVTEADTGSAAAAPLGSSTAPGGTTGSAISWSQVASSISASSASLATSTALPASAKPVPTQNFVPAVAPQASSCFSSYTGTATISGAGANTLPKPSHFVYRPSNAPTSLVVNNDAGQALPYRIVGANIYWLGLDENVKPDPSYPDKGRIREAIAIVAAMGGNTIRAETLGISVGNNYSVWPVIDGPVNNAAWDSMDYALSTAKHYGIRVVIPLTDQYNYYLGGKYTFLAKWGYDPNNKANGNYFYNDTRVIGSFKNYISVILNHVNTYTKVAYKNDQTILGWETGNELGAYMLEQGAPPAAWTTNITSFIKSIDKNHVIMDGSDGTHNSAGSPIPGLGVANVSAVTDHLYPLNNAIFNTDISLTNSAKKHLYIGEYDWTDLNHGDSLASFLSKVEATPYVGDMFWSVFGHDAACCNFVSHNDGYSLYYPNGNVGTLSTNVLALSQHFYRMTGRAVPSTLVGVACPQPSFNAYAP